MDREASHTDNLVGDPAASIVHIKKVSDVVSFFYD